MPDTRGSVSITVPRSAYPALAILVENLPRLDALGECILRADNELDVAKTASCLARELSMTDKDASGLLQALISLHSVRRGLEVSGEDFVELVTAALESGSEADWKAKHLDGWREGSPQLRALLDESHPSALLQKAVELTYAHQNVLQGVELITDIRPIFDEARSSVLATIVTHSLVVEYQQGSQRPERIHFALDDDDLATLKSLCERAEQKRSALRKTLAGIEWRKAT